MNVLTRLAQAIKGPPPLVFDEPAPAPSANDQGTNGLNPRDYAYSYFDGDKFAGGFGETREYVPDYWTLRRRSVQLFHENLYGRGIVRRLVTNEINTGLMPESGPEADILKGDDDELAEWSDLVETRFNLWASNAELCDYLGAEAWGAIQATARRESYVRGDVLCVVRFDKVTGLPKARLVCADNVTTPLEDIGLKDGHTIYMGVELDREGRQVAYWIKQDDGTHERQPAFGAKTGLRLAWLMYGTDQLVGDVRGQPLLAVVLQSLKAIDQYRDSTQRKATVNSMMAMQVTKSGAVDKMGSLPMQGGAVRKQDVSLVDFDSDNESAPREFRDLEFMPATIIDELQVGERLELLGGDGTDINFPEFEAAIISSVAWALEIPPEILKLSFSNNYSASQAAINEFKIALHAKWGHFGDKFCKPYYRAFVTTQVASGKIRADGFIEARNDPQRYDEYNAWLSVEWYGSIKPSTDMLKQARGSQILVDRAWSTNARESRGLTGSKFSTNIKRIERENEQLAKALRPRLELEQEFNVKISADFNTVTADELQDSLNGD